MTHPADDPRAKAHEFHAHLDVCRQCEEHPFALCPRGNQLLFAAVDEIPPPSRDKKDGHA